MTSTDNEVDHAKEAAQHERSLRALAENAKWLDENRDRTVQAAAWGRRPHPIDQTSKVKTLEARGTFHHWARHLTLLGHEVKLMPDGEYREFARVRRS